MKEEWKNSGGKSIGNSNNTNDEEIHKSKEWLRVIKPALK